MWPKKYVNYYLATVWLTFAQARIQDFLTGGVDCRGVTPFFPPLPPFSLPFPFIPFPLPFPSPSLPPSLPLEVGPLKSS